MNITVLEKTKDKMKMSFELNGITLALANSFRRMIMDEVPTMAIEDVEFRKNNSILYDEMIAHRLGLLPLKTDLKSYELPEKCSCKGEGCARCQLKLTLSEKGPKTVYASDIKSQDPKVIPVFPNTPIVKLIKGQDLELEATAILGKGKIHTKWSPGLVFYKNKPKVEIKGKCDSCTKCVEQCPVDIFTMKNKKLVINEKNLSKCHLCEACQEVCSSGAIKITANPSIFIFTVESWGQLNVKDVMLKACDVFKDKIDDFTTLVKALK